MTATSDVLAAVDKHGLLLVQDPQWPSVATMVAGEIVRGSWWGHPRGKVIFAVLSAIEDRDDVLFVKLVSGKVTLVHYRLWPAVLAVARQRAPWQMRGLPPGAKKLLADVDAQGRVRASGKDAKELEARLLVHGDQVHTESGAHAVDLEPWSAWAERAGVEAIAIEDATRSLESIVDKQNAATGAKATLPWQKKGA